MEMNGLETVFVAECNNKTPNMSYSVKPVKIETHKVCLLLSSVVSFETLNIEELNILKNKVIVNISVSPVSQYGNEDILNKLKESIETLDIEYYDKTGLFFWTKVKERKYYIRPLNIVVEGYTKDRYIEEKIEHCLILEITYRDRVQNEIVLPNGGKEELGRE